MGSKDISFFDLLKAIHSHGSPLEVIKYRADREILFQSRLGVTLYFHYTTTCIFVNIKKFKKLLAKSKKLCYNRVINNMIETYRCSNLHFW